MKILVCYLQLILFCIPLYAGIGPHCLETISLSSNKSIALRKYERREQVAHDSIIADLRNGQVIHWKSFSENNNKNSMFELKVYNSSTGRVRTVLFKPRFNGDGFGWNRVPMEIVAYQLGRMLNTDLIPPAVYRRNIILGDMRFVEGAFLYKVPDTHPLGKVDSRVWDLEFNYEQIDKDLFLSDARVIDVLLQNPDRHINNFMRGKHWVDGVYRPFLIDHAASLKSGFLIELNQNDAFRNGDVKKFRATTYEGLKKLSVHDLMALEGHLSKREIFEIYQRKQEILLYIESLITEHGKTNVIF